MKTDDFKKQTHALEQALLLLGQAQDALNRGGMTIQSAHVRELMTAFHVEHDLICKEWNAAVYPAIFGQATVEKRSTTGIFKGGLQ